MSEADWDNRQGGIRNASEPECRAACRRLHVPRRGAVTTDLGVGAHNVLLVEEGTGVLVTVSTLTMRRRLDDQN
jgi:hypothetical protein